MKKIYKLLALSLSTLTLATVGLSACKKKKEDATPTGHTEYVYNGTHIYTAPDTNEWLVKDGKTDYTLVVPANDSSTMRIARTEFLDLFKDATGIALTVLTDDKVQNAGDGKFISLGETKLLESSGIAVDKATLTADGHRIVTKDDDIYLCGGKDEGTVFSVYTFMRLTFNYETYYYDCMEIENTSEKKLKAYDVTDIPDFKFRAHSSDVTEYESADYDENMFAWRLNYYGKEGSRGYWYMPVHNDADDFTSKSGASTNIDHWFPYSTLKGEHPDWFSTRIASRGQQVCFTARGNEAEYQAMLDYAFDKVIKHLKHYTPDKYPRYRVMSMTHMDNTDYCRCDACMEQYAYYGDSVASTQILFMNDLMERVDAELEAHKGELWAREDFQMIFFAYNHNFIPPARYDVDAKKYVPIDEKVVAHDRLIAYFAREANGQMPFDGEDNASCLASLQGWDAVAKNIWFWDYGTNFKNYMIPLETFQWEKEDLWAYFCNVSDEFWFTQLQDGNRCGNTAWHNLKVYVNAKMAWDTSLNLQELIMKWMNAMFGDGAQTMYNLFQTIRSYQQKVLIAGNELTAGGDGSPDLLSPAYWPVGMLRGWIAQTDKAKEEVARLATLDPALYDRTCGHIEIEAISYLYLMIEMHGGKISKEEKAQYKARVEHDIDWLHLKDMEIRKETLSEWIAKK